MSNMNTLYVRLDTNSRARKLDGTHTWMSEVKHVGGKMVKITFEEFDKYLIKDMLDEDLGVRAYATTRERLDDG